MGKSIKGCIGFQGQKKDTSFFARLVKFFTYSKWSHSFIMVSEDTVLEANQTVQYNPLAEYRNDPNCYYELYSIVGADEPTVTRAIAKTTAMYLGQEYGYSQLLFFVYRWFNGLFLRERTPEVNSFPLGAICSEVVCYYEEQVSDKFTQLLAEGGLTLDTVSPQDLYAIISTNPSLFTLTESKT